MSRARRQTRSVPLLYGAVAVSLVAVIVSIAIVLEPTTAPNVAEFAPQAQEQIDESPSQQARQFESNDARCLSGLICDQEGRVLQNSMPSTTAAKARVRRCVGDPPRQVEDPQSPSCAPYWQGDNGGATSIGVTRDEIRF